MFTAANNGSTRRVWKIAKLGGSRGLAGLESLDNDLAKHAHALLCAKYTQGICNSRKDYLHCETLKNILLALTRVRTKG